VNSQELFRILVLSGVCVFLLKFLVLILAAFLMWDRDKRVKSPFKTKALRAILWIVAMPKKERQFWYEVLVYCLLLSGLVSYVLFGGKNLFEPMSPIEFYWQYPKWVILWCGAWFVTPRTICLWLVEHHRVLFVEDEEGVPLIHHLVDCGWEPKTDEGRLALFAYKIEREEKEKWATID